MFFCLGGGSRAFTGSPRLPGELTAGCGGSSRRLLATRQLAPATLRATWLNPCRSPHAQLPFFNTKAEPKKIQTHDN